MSTVLILRSGDFNRRYRLFICTVTLIILIFLLFKINYPETQTSTGRDSKSFTQESVNWKSLMLSAVEPFMSSGMTKTIAESVQALQNATIIHKNLTIEDLLKINSEAEERNKDSSLIGYPHQICGCGTYSPPDRPSNQRNLENISSTCSHEATLYGTGQKVRSYTLYINQQENIREFVFPIEDNLRANSELFPGWITRIYSNISTANPHVCGLICKYPNLFWCDIKNIPEMGDLSNMNGRTWRFLALGDPTVDIFLSRDMDGPIFPRERAAVAEWESSDLPFHSMRDNPAMKTPIQAGLWGAKNFMLGPLFSKFLQKTLIRASKENNTSIAWDEDILKMHLHNPYASSMFLLHDSYHCNDYNEFKKLPFPTQRIGNQTVGVSQFTQKYSVPPCPVQCRPVYGKHWEFC